MRTIVMLSGIPYEYLKHRPQHFATYFSRKGYEVLYICITDYTKIDPVNLGNIKDRDSFKDSFFSRNADDVFVIKNSIHSEEINDSSLTLLIKKINEIYNEKNPIFIAAFPQWITHLQALSKNSTLIYDCLDDWEEFTKDPEMGYSEEIIHCERKIASIADLVITSAKRLYVKMSYYNNNVYYLPNGVWNAEFTQQAVLPQVPVDLKPINKPIVFFMGAIAKWVDLDLIQFIAESRPEYSFVFAGNLRCDLPKRLNIYFLGSKKYEELPHYLAVSKVCIIPFKVNNLTAAVTPLKIYEYLASSTPVVTTIMPDILELPGTRAATTYNEFVEYLDEFTSMNNEEYTVETKMAKKSVELYNWSDLLEPINNMIKKDSYEVENNENVIKNTILSYKNYKHSFLIQNELLGMYNYLGLYNLSCSLYDFNDDTLEIQQHLDYEKLALAHFYSGSIDMSKKLLNMYIENNDKKVLQPYVHSLLKEEDFENFLEIYLLKVSGSIYEAIRLADSQISPGKYQPQLLGLLSGLYLDIGEYDLAFQVALEILAGENELKLENIFDAYTLKFIIKTFSEQNQYDLAEEFTLTLMQINKDWQHFFVSLLSDVYISKHLVE